MRHSRALCSFEPLRSVQTDVLLHSDALRRELKEETGENDVRLENENPIPVLMDPGYVVNAARVQSWLNGLGFCTVSGK